MEPRCEFEPVLATWANWEWSHFPELAPLVQSSQLLTIHTVELSRLIAGLGIRSSAAALQTFYSGAHLFQQAWLQSALILSSGNDSEAAQYGTQLLPHAAGLPDTPERAGSPNTATETPDEWSSQDIDAALSSHAA
jgi:hypothetical protein